MRWFRRRSGLPGSDSGEPGPAELLLVVAHGPFGETYYEMSFGSAGSGRYVPTGRYLRHADVEELVQGAVEPLTFDDCGPACLRKRGVRVWTVS
jgi:hypothetical protein